MTESKDYRFRSNEAALSVLEDFTCVPGGEAWNTVDKIDQAINDYNIELIDIMSKMGIYGNPMDVHVKSNNSDFYDISSDKKAELHRNLSHASLAVAEAFQVLRHLIFALGEASREVKKALETKEISAEWEVSKEPTKSWQHILADEKLQRDILKMEYNLQEIPE